VAALIADEANPACGEFLGMPEPSPFGISGSAQIHSRRAGWLLPGRNKVDGRLPCCGVVSGNPACPCRVYFLDLLRIDAGAILVTHDRFSYYGGGQRVWPLRRLSWGNARLTSPHLIAPVIGGLPL